MGNLLFGGRWNHWTLVLHQMGLPGDWSCEGTAPQRTRRSSINSTPAIFHVSPEGTTVMNAS